MKPTFASNPPQSGPRPWGRTAPAADGPETDNPETDNIVAKSGQPAQYFVVPTTLYASPSDSVHEAETRVILEMRYQEHAARRALEELFERGELELLSG
jgi:hypothetical protein